jgi:hypothetical protein
MIRPVVTINRLIIRGSNYVEEDENKSPLGAGFRPNANAALAILHLMKIDISWKSLL